MASSESDHKESSSAIHPIASPSPSPSPALSAYSSTTSSSSIDNEYDLNSLSLDDWGYPRHIGEGISPGNTARRFKNVNNQASQDYFNGSSTPIAKRHPSAALIHGDPGSEQSTPGENEEAAEEEEDEEDIENGFDLEDEDEEDMHAYGVPAARGWRLKANKAQTPAFRSQVLAMFSTQLKLDTWSKDTVDPTLLPLSPNKVQLKRISGAFSNAVFFVSYKVPSNVKAVGPRTVLLRVYGSGTEVLLSRRTELLILHTLSSLYEIGPHILGTFANGRVETFFDAEPIGKDGIRDLGDRRETVREDGTVWVKGQEGRAQWVARRMRQMHEVPLDTMRAVLEQGDLRTGSGNSSGLFGRGIENHLFARSHRPKMAKKRSSMQQGILSENKFLPGLVSRDSPAPMTPADGSSMNESSITASAIDGVQVQAMAIRGRSPQHRASSVASFDSLATSYSSQDGGSISSGSTDDLLNSPSFGPSSYSDSIAAARKSQSQSPHTFRRPGGEPRRGSSSGKNSSSASRQPYPGVWRRTKRWAREAGKVFAMVDEFCQTEQGGKACKEALEGTVLEGVAFTPFPVEPLPRTHSLKLGTTLQNLQKTLLAIASIDFPRMLAEMDAYKRYARQWEKANGTSKRVLTHGDTQYSNLLLIKDGEEGDVGIGMPRGRDRSRDRSTTVTDHGVKAPSRQRSRAKQADFERLIVIDFEYCSPNPRAYDIANAFHEWRFDYHCETDSWSPYSQPYPTRDEQRRWLRAYVEQGRVLRTRGKTPKTNPDSNATSLPAEELTLPPAMVPTESQNSCTEAEAVKARYLDDASNPSKIVDGSKNKKGIVSSPLVIASASPSLNPSASPVISTKSSIASQEPNSMEREIDRLEKEVQIFSIACHANWALWGITFAKEQIESVIENVLSKMGAEDEVNLLEEADQTIEPAVAGCAESFDNLRYSLSRVELFREEIAAFGIQV